MRTSIKSDFLQFGERFKTKTVRPATPETISEINHAEVVETEYIYEGCISKHTFDNWPMAQQLEYIKHFQEKNKDVSFCADPRFHFATSENFDLGFKSAPDYYGDRYNRFGAMLISADQLFWEMNPAIAIQIATENQTSSDLLAQQVEEAKNDGSMQEYLNQLVSDRIGEDINQEHGTVGGNDAPTSPTTTQAGLFGSISPMILVVGAGLLLFGFVKKG